MGIGDSWFISFIVVGVIIAIGFCYQFSQEDEGIDNQNQREPKSRTNNSADLETGNSKIFNLEGGSTSSSWGGWFSGGVDGCDGGGGGGGGGCSGGCRGCDGGGGGYD